VRPFAKTCIALAALGMLAFGTPAWAQRGRGGIRASGGARMAPAPRTFTRAPLPASRSVGRVAVASGFRSFSTRSRYPYWRRRGYLVPIWWGGTLCYFDTGDPYYSSCYGSVAPPYYGTEYYDQSQQDYSASAQQAPIVVPSPPAAPAQYSAGQYTAPPPEPAVAPFLLIRRDGQIIETVAFTVVGDRLTYITSAGLRRSFPLAELDKDATRDWNDARGSSVALPG